MSNCSARTATSSKLPDRAPWHGPGVTCGFPAILPGGTPSQVTWIPKIHSAAMTTGLTRHPGSTGEQDLHRAGGEDGHARDGGQDEQRPGTHEEPPSSRRLR